MKRLLAIIGPSIMMLLGGAIVGFGFQWLLIPEELLSGGISGVSMILGYMTGWNIGILYFALNIPIIIWGYYRLGKKYILLSLINIVATTLFLQLVPLINLTEDRLLSAVFGGVAVGIGTALALRFGGSTGGFDIIASIIARTRDVPIGLVIISMNTLVAVALGLLKSDWNAALYAMLSIYLTGKVIDTIHTPHRKVTAFIITNKTDVMTDMLLAIPRGVTIVSTQGAYTKDAYGMLMTVTTRYELTELRKIVRSIDRQAFVNVVPTIDVIGQFRRK